MQLGHCHVADGAYRVYVFSGGAEPMSESCGVKVLCEFLASDANSPLKKYTPIGADPDSVIDVRAIFQPHHQLVGTDTLHAVLAPRKGRYGLRDHEKVFCVDNRPKSSGGGRNIYEVRGINKKKGCVVVVRPDQYVADVLPLGDHAGLAKFLVKF